MLLDELATGTDPREGEALAAGVLDSLCARGGAVAATTHYEGLKALALADARFENASVGFDLATMTPDVPPRAWACRAARARSPSRAGSGCRPRSSSAPSASCRARTLSFEELVKKLNDERAALDLARQAAEAREREAEELRARLEEELAAAEDREKRTLSREAEQLMASVRRAREELRVVQARLRAKSIDEPAALREAMKTLDRVAEEVAIGERDRGARRAAGASARRGEARRSSARGRKVYVPRLRAEAEIVDVSGDNVRVAAGSLKLTVQRRRAARGDAAGATPSRAAHRAARGARSARAGRSRRRDNSVDLRGLRADDALSLATTFLDRSINAGRRVAFLVHGHGTGALRDAIRRELEAEPVRRAVSPRRAERGRRRCNRRVADVGAASVPRAIFAATRPVACPTMTGQ